MNPRIYVISMGAEKPKGVPGWPNAELHPAQRATELFRKLMDSFPAYEFLGGELIECTEADFHKMAARVEKEDPDGVLIFGLAIPHRSIKMFGELNRPMLWVNDIYGGELYFFDAMEVGQEDGWPFVALSSSRFSDIGAKLRYFDVIHGMRHSRVVAVRNRDYPADYLNKIKRQLGVEVIRVDHNDVNAVYNAVPEEEAKAWAKRWIAEAEKVMEPRFEDVLAGAKMYLTLKALMAREKANSVTVDCLDLVYNKKIPAYPCLAFFQLNNEGSTGICEADIDSLLTQLVIRFLTGLPGYVSDPVIDQGTGQIIYAHCVAASRMKGPKSEPMPYVLRSHAEDNSGASVQVKMTPGEIMSTIKFDIKTNRIAFHKGKIVGNVDTDRACRTKVAVEVDTAAVARNYQVSKFGWHRVSFYGDWETEIRELAQLMQWEFWDERK